MVILETLRSRTTAVLVEPAAIREQTNGTLDRAGVYVGYGFRLGSGLTVEPQAQLAYQNVSFDTVSDTYGRFAVSDQESLRGRLGVRVAKDWSMTDEAAPRHAVNMAGKLLSSSPRRSFSLYFQPSSACQRQR